MKPSYTLPTPIETLNALLESISAEQELTDDHIMALMNLCGQQGQLGIAAVMGALRLLDIPESVDKWVAQRSQRTVYKVKDLESELQFSCRPAQRYCTCDAFLQVMMSDAIVCEHVLAAQLAEALGTIKQTNISDNEFSEHC